MQSPILITGATGLLGGALTARLDREGTPWASIRHANPRWNPGKGEIGAELLENHDTVVHLAGEPLVAARWTEEKKRAIRDSRVNGTRAIAGAMAKRSPRPKTLVCASAIGYYGDRGDEELDEGSEAGEGFLADVVRDWEAAADPAREAGIRVAHLRLGVVLSTRGGALAKMLPVFKWGLGGRLGDGRMWMSWVHLDDAAAAFHRACVDPNLSGAYNLAAPRPVTNRTFTKALGEALGRPTALPAPAFALKLLLGGMAEEMLLCSVRAIPARLEKETDFRFAHPDLRPALGDLLGNGDA